MLILVISQASYYYNQYYKRGTTVYKWELKYLNAQQQTTNNFVYTPIFE